MAKQPEQLNGNPISDTAIRQPVLISMVMLLLIVLGSLSLTRMPVNLLPDFDVPVVVITVPYPGAGPETVADQIARPIEDELSTLNGVDTITSNASDGFGTVVVEFQQQIDSATALQEVRERIVALRPTLPEDIQEPTFQRFDPAQEPVLRLAISSRSGMDPQALRTLIDDQIVPAVQQQPGVGSTSLIGGRVRQIDVNLELDRLQALRVLPSQISQAIAAANTNVGIGDALLDGQEVNLRTPSVFNTPADIATVGIPGTPYTVADVATVADSQAEVTTIARLDGADAITLDVRRQSGTNTVAVADAALQAFEQAAARYPDLTYTVVQNDADAVRQNVLGAVEEIAIALGFAILVVMLFFSGIRPVLRTSLLPGLVLLGGIVVLPALGMRVSLLYPIALAVVLLVVQTLFTDRNTFITVVGLPMIILGTFAGMALFGLSINIITLLAISVSVGLVIDDAIVVRENIIHRLEQGDSPIQAASRGAGEVALSVLAMTLTIIAVFVPVAFTTGTTGIIFCSFGITVAVAMAVSLIEAYTFAPMLSAYLIRRKRRADDKRQTTDSGQQTTNDQQQPVLNGAAHHQQDESATVNGSLSPVDHPPVASHGQSVGSMARLYGRMLAWSLRWRWATIGIGVAIIALTVVLGSGLRTSFLPTQEDYRFGASFQLPAGTPLADTDQVAREFEQIIQNDPAVASVLTTVGGSDFDSGGAEQARFLVILDRSTPSQTVIERLRPQLAAFPRLAMVLPSYESGTGTELTSRPIQFQVRGSGDFDQLAPVVDQITTALRDVPGLANLDTSYSPGAPELRYALDQRRANDYGLTNADFAQTLRTLIDGDTAAVYREGGENYDIVVRLRQEDRQAVETLNDIVLPFGTELLPLSTVATVQQDSSPTTIRRVDRQNEVLIGASNNGRNINEVVQDAQARVAAIALPAGVTLTLGGASEDQSEGFTGLLVAMALSVVFVYMVLASQFRSFSQPIVLMLAMPLSFIGAFLALQITGRELDILAMIGMLMLLGLVVKNSILLVDQANQLRAQGLEKHAALREAGLLRFRPIMMTSLTIVFGVLPAASGFGYGAALRQGLATVVIGGIITSTVLTLLLVPTAYSLLDGLTTWLGRLRHRDQDEDADDATPPPSTPSTRTPALRPVAVAPVNETVAQEP